MNRKFDKAIFSEKLTEELGIPKNVVSGFNHIELFGNREAVVNTCEGILEYSDTRIKINIGKNTVLFCGNDLCMKEYGACQAVITGIIMSVEFG